MQSTWGFSIAASIRSVIFFPEIAKEVWTLATTQSSAATRSSG